MIYIRVEDSTDGFVLCQNIVRIYFKIIAILTLILCGGYLILKIR